MRIRQNLTQGDLACRFFVEDYQSLVPYAIAVVLSDLIQWPHTAIEPTLSLTTTYPTP